MFVFKWVRWLYEKTLELSKHPKAVYWLALISFAESSFFPFPPDLILLPLCLANRRRALLYAAICTAASIAGALAGYAIGSFAFDSVGEPILAFYGAHDKFDQVQLWYQESGSLMVLIAGFTPIPYKVITLTAGVFSFPLLPFILFSIISRGLRFSIEAFVIQRFGEPALDFIDRHFNSLTVIAAILFVGGFLIVKLLLGH